MLAPGFCGGTIAAPAGAGAPAWRATWRISATAANVTQAAALLTTDKIEPSSTVGDRSSVPVVPYLSNPDRTFQVSALRSAPNQRGEELTR
jgi:hypothetical protein